MISRIRWGQAPTGWETPGWAPLVDPGPLTRAVFEYAVVFVLAVLVATTGVPVDQPPTTGGQQASAAADQRPALIKTIDGFQNWLSRWRAWARTETDRRPTSSSAPAPTRKGETQPALSPHRPGGPAS